MFATIALLGSLGLARLLTLSSGLTAAQPTIAWSPDSRWIAYTSPIHSNTRLSPDWLFNVDSADRRTGASGVPNSDQAENDAPVYRIWASRRDSNESALIEESKGFLSAPAWRPDGGAIAFVRVTPRDSNGNRCRGTFEVVVRDGLERSKTLFALEDFDFDGSSLEELLNSAIAWNRDGTGLAVNRPGEPGAVLVLSARTGRIVRTIENVGRPSWSPDGNRLAVIRQGTANSAGDSLLVVDSPLTKTTDPRAITSQDRMLQPALWTADSQSVLAVYNRARTTARSQQTTRDIVLGRFNVINGDKLRELSLGSQSPTARLRNDRPLLLGRAGALVTPPADEPVTIPLPGPSPRSDRYLDFDPDSEECFHLGEGLASSIVCYNLRTDITHRRFPPLDLSATVGTLAISPDGRTLALRFGTADGASAPVLCDLATETLSIPTPDPATRSRWLSTLVEMTRTHLRQALPSPTVLGAGMGERPMLIPAPGEITPGHALAARIQRLSRIGRALVEPPPTEVGTRADENLVIQAGFFFNYLVGDVGSAERFLDQLEATALSTAQRRAILSARAQILMSRGEAEQAHHVIEYLSRIESERIRTVEETPNGFSSTAKPNPRWLWARYLAQRHEDSTKRKTQLKISQPDNPEIRAGGRHELPGLGDRPIDAAPPFNPDGRFQLDPPIFVRP